MSHETLVTHHQLGRHKKSRLIGSVVEEAENEWNGQRTGIQNEMGSFSAGKKTASVWGSREELGSKGTQKNKRNTTGKHISKNRSSKNEVQENPTTGSKCTAERLQR